MFFSQMHVLSCLHFKDNYDRERTHTRCVYDYEIDLYRTGDRTLIIDGEQYTISDDTCAIRRPGQIVTGIGRSINAYCLTLCFSDKGSRAFLSRKEAKPPSACINHPILQALPSVFRVREAMPIVTLYETICRLSHCTEREAEAEAYAEKLLLRLAAEAIQPTPAPTPREETETVRKRLHSEMGQTILLGALAREVGFTSAHLIRLFRHDFGCTPMEYLIRLRMEHAHLLLTETDHPIGEIAARCGYSNFAFFSSTFKARYGDTPREYRRRALSADA